MSTQTVGQSSFLSTNLKTHVWPFISFTEGNIVHGNLLSGLFPALRVIAVSVSNSGNQYEYRWGIWCQMPTFELFQKLKIVPWQRPRKQMAPYRLQGKNTLQELYLNKSINLKAPSAVFLVWIIIYNLCCQGTRWPSPEWEPLWPGLNWVRNI